VAESEAASTFLVVCDETGVGGSDEVTHLLSRAHAAAGQRPYSSDTGTIP